MSVQEVQEATIPLLKHSAKYLEEFDTDERKRIASQILIRVAKQQFQVRVQAVLSKELIRHWTRQIDGMLCVEDLTDSSSVELVNNLVKDAVLSLQVLSCKLEEYPILQQRFMETTQTNESIREAKIVRDKCRKDLESMLFDVGMSLSGRVDEI